MSADTRRADPSSRACLRMAATSTRQIARCRHEVGPERADRQPTGDGRTSIASAVALPLGPRLMSEPPVDLDDQAELLVLHVATSAVADRRLPATRGQPVGPFDVTEVPKLRGTVRARGHVGEHLEQHASVGLSLPGGQGRHELVGGAQPQVQGAGGEHDRAVERPAVRQVEHRVRAGDPVRPRIRVHARRARPAAPDRDAGTAGHEPGVGDGHVDHVGLGAHETPRIPCAASE